MKWKGNVEYDYETKEYNCFEGIGFINSHVNDVKLFWRICKGKSK